MIAGMLFYRVNLRHAQCAPPMVLLGNGQAVLMRGNEMMGTDVSSHISIFFIYWAISISIV